MKINEKEMVILPRQKSCEGCLALQFDEGFTKMECVLGYKMKMVDEFPKPAEKCTKPLFVASFMREIKRRKVKGFESYSLGCVRCDVDEYSHRIKKDSPKK